MARKLICLFILLMMACAIASNAAGIKILSKQPYQNTPVWHGYKDLSTALKSVPFAKSGITITITSAADKPGTALQILPKKAESFVIARKGKDITIIGRDKTGAMYGCFELAERIGMQGMAALDIRKPIVQSPAIDFRAVNPFLTLPYKCEYKDWWFLQNDYWEAYLDQLAHARINWIDMHGMYDIQSTGFPNIYPYFISSDKYPEVGVDQMTARRNLIMLNRVIAMAKQRGIHFAMMSYSTSWDGPGMRKVPYKQTEENCAEYTREVVRKMIQSCPGLEMIGFRIGETGRSEDFFKNSYVPAIKEANRPIDLYTRTWLAHKEPIVGIGEEFPGRFFAEIKYNGEQYGPPYIIAGGRMAGWHSYSYQDYYSYPKSYKIIYQLRANGTHRVFPWGNPELAAESNEGSLLGGAIGLCVEPMDAYYPAYDLRHKADYPYRWYKYQYQRDWYWYQVWGRTAYDPSLGKKDSVWTSMLSQRFGKAAPAIYQAMNWASKIVPDAYTAYSLGPDHRNHAPELETGGTVKNWADGQPFDTQNVQSPREYANRLMTGDYSAKASPLEMARYLAEEANMTRKYIAGARKQMLRPTKEFNDLMNELTMLSYLGDYYSHKLTAATYYAVMEASKDTNLQDRIKNELTEARTAWDKLAAAGDKYYQPFVDTLRMHTEDYLWSKEGKNLDRDIPALDGAVEAIKNSGETGKDMSILKITGTGPKIDGIKVSTRSEGEQLKELTVTVTPAEPAKVKVIYLKAKPFPSERLWSLAPMTRQGNTFVGSVRVRPEGLMWCIEAIGQNGGGTRWPDFRKEAPYREVLPWYAQTTQLNAGTALDKLAKGEISANGYSAMIAGGTASALNSASAETHAALLKKVEDGMPLIILAQDAPGNWNDSWLPGNIQFTDTDADSVKLVGNHPILSGVAGEINSTKIANDELAGGDEAWVHLSDPKALAVRQYGKGSIILVQMDVRNFKDNAAVTKLMGSIINFATNGSKKPVLIIDPGKDPGNLCDMLDYLRKDFKVLGWD